MGRTIAKVWHALFALVATALYFFFVLPRWPELTGHTTHALGTALRIVTGVVIALAALPAVFTLLRARKPEYGTPVLALRLLTWSIVAHLVAGGLIIGTAISEIWLSPDNIGQWLFGTYGAAAAIALLGILGFYLSFVAELSPPPPKPVKPNKPKAKRRLRRKKGAESPESDAEESAADETEADETKETEAEETQAESAEEELVGAPPAGGRLRNRRPTGKSSRQR